RWPCPTSPAEPTTAASPAATEEQPRGASASEGRPVRKPDRSGRAGGARHPEGSRGRSPTGGPCGAGASSASESRSRRRRLVAATPLGRAGTPGGIAATVEFLASPGARTRPGEPGPEPAGPLRSGVLPVSGRRVGARRPDTGPPGGSRGAGGPEAAGVVGRSGVRGLFPAGGGRVSIVGTRTHR